MLTLSAYDREQTDESISLLSRRYKIRGTVATVGMVDVDFGEEEMTPCSIPAGLVVLAIYGPQDHLQR